MVLKRPEGLHNFRKDNKVMFEASEVKISLLQKLF